MAKKKTSRKTGRKTSKTSKSQAIRDFMAAHPEVTDAKQIAEGASAKFGEPIRPQNVYQLRTSRQNVSTNHGNMDTLLVAADLLKRTGGLAEAHKCLEIVARIRE